MYCLGFGMITSFLAIYIISSECLIVSESYHVFGTVEPLEILHSTPFFYYRDAAALAEFWAWLEAQIQDKVILTEVEVAERLLTFRAKRPGFLDTSFDTISGTPLPVFVCCIIWRVVAKLLLCMTRLGKNCSS